ncbi:MAG TPA: prepilin-type N-terminal cleavage/methylation domain-containing protein [Candidatus Dormibacteraeota bacterium]|jgi:prepilin-type N-terminal cleavage/methylation domain-containing protein
MAPDARRSQAGYTLIEVVISVAIGAILMAALTSVVLTSVRAADIASSRVEASGQLRSFEFFAYDDFAGSGVPDTATCGDSSSTACTTQPITLAGVGVSNSVSPAPSASSVTYTWDSTNFFLDRKVGANPAIHAATDVSAFSWYVDSSGASPVVVVRLKVTVSNYSESQTLLFYPRLNP